MLPHKFPFSSRLTSPQCKCTLNVPKTCHTKQVVDFLSKQRGSLNIYLFTVSLSNIKPTSSLEKMQY